MALKIWTSPLSYNCLRPNLVLAEKDITDYEEVPADLITGKHKTSEFLEKSLFGRVPLLEDGGVSLFESRAITRYLALKYWDVGPKLMPDLTDAKTSGVWEMRLIVEVEEFDIHAVPVINETLIRPVIGKPTDEVILSRHQTRLSTCLDALDEALSLIPYMGGDEYSLVDISYMPSMHVVSKCVDVFAGRPNLQRWWADVTGREAWKKVVLPLNDAYSQAVPGWNK